MAFWIDEMLVPTVDSNIGDGCTHVLLFWLMPFSWSKCSLKLSSHLHLKITLEYNPPIYFSCLEISWERRQRQGQPPSSKGSERRRIRLRDLRQRRQWSRRSHGTLCTNKPKRWKQRKSLILFTVNNDDSLYLALPARYKYLAQPARLCLPKLLWVCKRLHLDLRLGCWEYTSARPLSWLEKLEGQN